MDCRIMGPTQSDAYNSPLHANLGYMELPGNDNRTCHVLISHTKLCGSMKSRRKIVSLLPNLTENLSPSRVVTI